MEYMVNKVDAWKDALGGWTINDVIRDCARVNLDNPYSVREVLARLREIAPLPKGTLTTNIKDFCSDSIFEVIDRKTLEPIIQLERV